MAVFSVGELDDKYGDAGRFREIARDAGFTHFLTTNGDVGITVQAGAVLEGRTSSGCQKVIFTGSLRWYAGAGWHVECEVVDGVLTQVKGA